MELILHTFGTSISKDSDGFVITNQNGRKRLPSDGITSIHIGRGVQITSDAVMLAIEKEIEVLIIDKSGKNYGRVWSNKYGSISTIRKGQLEFVSSPKAVEWIKSVITQKILNQQALLLAASMSDMSGKSTTDKAVSRLEEYINKVKKLNGERLIDIAPIIRGWEGNCSKIYFDVYNIFLSDKYKFKTRSQHPAMDIVNAFLNYGYGILYGKIEGALIEAGIDPYIGVLHRDEYNRPVLVYDIIELYRVWVDYVVFHLAKQEVINEDFYSISADGSFWLETLGRRVIIQSMNDYLDEVVDIEGVRRSRITHVSYYCKKLAQDFKSIKDVRCVSNG